ncbi:GGDEF domain-containing response regulator [Teredinibacter sp. KSP-S5-2]|uniref:GGDEF domain-containing protein n=1 Tax=Teredinibacter sp. KSP-S5-2 TaxID=3034506 RepID=UPI002934C8C8|nr:GGDEF domain-containing response regulator [Teredinibacter sp. KSP-S5-2]WNO07531.1 GGDEF domain-containing response regulator [Teredinibacter sp. KSP-S5-2]
MNSGRKISVLVIDDDYDDFYIVNRMLSSMQDISFNLLHVYDIESAETALQQSKVDVALLDLNLDKYMGINTLIHFKKSASEIPVIVFTGSNDEGMGELAIREGAEDYIPKNDVSASVLSRSICYAIERYELKVQLEKQLKTDVLTNLYNRAALFDRLEILIDYSQRAHDSKLAVALLDLDEFKGINDQYGHRSGDELLKQFGLRLKNHLRASDMAARLGGDEFVLVFTNYQSIDNLLLALKQKHENLVKPYKILVNSHVKEFVIGISIGICEWMPGMTPQKLLSYADEAMYESKRKGKNQLSIYSLEEK